MAERNRNIGERIEKINERVKLESRQKGSESHMV